MGVFNKTIIPLALVGYEMIIANSALRASLAIYHLISNAPSWNNCLLSNIINSIQKVEASISVKKILLVGCHVKNAWSKSERGHVPPQAGWIGWMLLWVP